MRGKCNGRRRFAREYGLAIALIAIAGCGTEPPRAPPTTIPKSAFIPPGSTAPPEWTPPKTTLPAVFVDNVNFLLNHGLPDPRTGEFCLAEATLDSGDAVWPPNYRGYGWVIKSGSKAGYFLGLNGIAYERSHRPESQKSTNLKSEALPPINATNERMPFQPMVPPPYDPGLAAALLLVAGMPRQAEALAPRTQSTIYTLSASLLQAKWIQAVAAFTADKDVVALGWAQQIATLAPAYQGRLPNQRNPYPFLSQLAELRSECAAPKPQRKAPTLEDKLAAQRNATVDTLTLGKADNQLLDELFTCACSDSHRLTRVGVLTKDGARVLTLPESAARTFARLSLMSLTLPGARTTPTVSQIQAWWTQNRPVSLPERAYRGLANDRGSPSGWAFSGQAILPVNITVPRTVDFQLLRWGHSPSVAALFSKRIIDLASRPDGLAPAPGLTDTPAISLMNSLLEWDPQAALKPLAVLTRAASRPGSRMLGGNPYAELAIIHLFQTRAQHGDKSAYADCVPLLEDWASQPESRCDDFHIFYDHRDEPAFAGFAKRVFLDPVRNGGPASWDQGVPLAVRVMLTPMLTLPEERQALQLLLANRLAMTIAHPPSVVYSKNAWLPWQLAPQRACDLIADWLGRQVLSPSYVRPTSQAQRDDLIARLTALLGSPNANLNAPKLFLSPQIDNEQVFQALSPGVRYWPQAPAQ